MPNPLDPLASLASVLRGSVLVAELIVALVELLALLLQSLKILLLLGKLLLERGELTRLSSNGELLALLCVLVGTLVGAETVLETHDLHDHHVGAVENEREEEGEAAEVHVALGVELAGLDFETLVAHDGTAVKGRSVIIADTAGKEEGERTIPWWRSPWQR